MVQALRVGLQVSRITPIRNGCGVCSENATEKAIHEIRGYRT